MNDSTVLFQQARQSAEPVSFDMPWGVIRGLAWGNANAKPLLALHGWLDNAHSFIPFAEAFLHSDLVNQYRLIAIDWAGHGHSDHRAKGNYYPFMDYVYDLWYLCEQYLCQQHQQVTIVAHSMGAYIANMYAGIEPQRVNHLLAVEAFGLLASTPAETTNDLRKGFQSRWQQQDKQRPHYRELSTAVAARTHAGDFSRELAALLVERGIEQLGEHDFRFRADGQLRLKSPVRLTSEQIADVLSHITCTFDVVLGKAGHARLHEAIAQWKPYVKQLKLHELDGGHHVHMEQPTAIIGLLSQITRAHNG